MKARGYKVTMQKMDPYLNVDPGTMSPFQHGEVFVTEDGHEGDLDLGHYERFIDENLSRESNFTQGSIYQTLIAPRAPRRFLGGTVQVIPHVTEAIKRADCAAQPSSPAPTSSSPRSGAPSATSRPAVHRGGAPVQEGEAPWQRAVRPRDARAVIIAAAHEVKTKPTQHSVKELRSIGVQPDFIVCRSDHENPTACARRSRCSATCDTDEVLACPDAPSIYEVPISLHEQGFDALGPGEDRDLRAGEIEARRLARLPEGEGRLFRRAGHRRGGHVSPPDAYLLGHRALVAAASRRAPR
ncbi:MAG: CTP synthase [Adlercreutzia equolifaciens]